jgi:hypothetical protein
VFVPSKDESEVMLMRYTWYKMGHVAVQQLLGWPMYLFINASGREYSRWASHFDPTSPIFSKRERVEVRVYPWLSPLPAAAFTDVHLIGLPSDDLVFLGGGPLQLL